MKTKTEKLDSLVADPNNARVHGPRNLAAIKDSVSRFGQRRPLVAQTGSRVVIAGNGLMEALRQLGRTTAEVLWVDDDPATAAAFALADNRAAELAAWDYDALRLSAEQAGDKLVGWTPEELAGLLAVAETKALIGANYDKVGSKPAAEKRPQPVALLLMPDAIGAVQGAIERVIQSGAAMSASAALVHICERFSDGKARRR